MLQQVVPQACQSLDLVSVGERGPGVQGPARHVPLAAASDGVKAFQRKAERIDSSMAGGAARLAGMQGHQLAQGQPLGSGFIGRKLGHVLGRPRQLLSQEYFADPVAAQDGTGPGGSRLLAQSRGQRQDTAPPMLLHPPDAAPALSPHALNAIKLCQSLVDEGVIGIEQAQQGAVALKQIGKEADGLLVHVPAYIGKLGEVLLAFFFDLVEVVDVQPLAGELGGQTPHPAIGQHAPGLPDQHLGRTQPALGGQGAQLPVRLGGPEEVAQAAGELPVGDFSRGFRRRFFQPVQEGGGDKNPGQGQPEGHFVGEFLLAQAAVQPVELLHFPVGQRTAVGSVGKVDQGRQLPGLGIDQFVAKGGRLPVEGLLQRQHGEVLGTVLSSVADHGFQKQVQGRHPLKGALADEAKFFPEPVEPSPLAAVQHEPGQMVILSIEQLEGEDLVDRHDLVEAERRRKEAAVFVQGRLDSPPGAAGFGHQDGPGEGEVPAVREHLGHARVQDVGPTGQQAGGLRRLSQHQLHLHTALAAGFLVQHGPGDQVAAGCQGGGQANGNHRRRAHHERVRVDGLAVGMPAEHGRVQAPLGIFRRGLAGFRPAHSAAEAAHLPQQNVGSAHPDQARPFQDHEVIFVPVAGIGNHQRHQHFPVSPVRRSGRNGGAQELLEDQGVDRLHPALGASGSSDQAHRAKHPKRLLPGGDRRGQGPGIRGTGASPAGTQVIQKGRGGDSVETGPQPGEVPGIQPVLPGHGCHPLAAGPQRLPLGQRGRKVFLQRQDSGQPDADVAVDVDVPHLRTHSQFPDLHEPAVELADLGQYLVGPVAPGPLRGKAEAIRQQHGVLGNGLAGVEILLQQAGRHDQGVAGIGESFPGRAVGGELPGRVQGDPRQVANGVGVLGIVEPSQHHRPRVPGVGQRLRPKIALRPLQQDLPLLRPRLAGSLRGHLPLLQHFDHLEPGPGVPPHLGQGGEPLQVEFPRPQRGRMAPLAELTDQRAHLSIVLESERLEGLGLLARGQQWRPGPRHGQ